MKFTVYRWTNKINGKVYIGQTSTSLEQRFSVHKTLTKSGSQYKFHQALRKYGVEGFNVDVLSITDNLIDATFLECKFISENDSYRNGYNMTFGGQGSPCTPEKALKISEAKKGKPLPHMIGNKYSTKMRWINNGEDNLRIDKDTQIPEGYHKGRINTPGERINGTVRPKFTNGYKPSTKPRKPMTDEHKSKAVLQLQSGKGTVWANNGQKNVRITLPLPEGFNPGRIIAKTTVS